MFIVDMDKIMTDYPNLASMLRDMKIEPTTFNSIKNNKTGKFNPLKGEKSYKAFQKLEKVGYIIRKNFKGESK